MAVRHMMVRLCTSGGSPDSEGRLLFVDERLVAVISLLSADHDELAGRWFIEATFGVPGSDSTFETLAAATQWVTSHSIP